MDKRTRQEKSVKYKEPEDEDTIKYNIKLDVVDTDEGYEDEGRLIYTITRKDLEYFELKRTIEKIQKMTKTLDLPSETD